MRVCVDVIFCIQNSLEYVLLEYVCVFMEYVCVFMRAERHHETFVNKWMFMRFTRTVPRWKKTHTNNNTTPKAKRALFIWNWLNTPGHSYIFI